MKKGSIFFIIFILAMAAFFGIYSMSYSHTKTKLLPIIVSAIMFVLGIAQLVNEIYKKKTEQEKGDAKVTGSKKERTHQLFPYVVYFAWLLGLVLGIYTLGFIISIPIFIFCFLLFHGEKWYKSVSTAAITTIVLYVVFELIFKFDLYDGKFIKMLS